MAITEGIQGTAVTAVKINGVRKTVTQPVTGFALHSLAGFPDKLTGPGGTVEKTTDPVKLEADAEFTADYGQGKGIDQPHPLPSKKDQQASPPSSPPATNPLFTPAVSSPPQHP